MDPVTAVGLGVGIISLVTVAINVGKTANEIVHSVSGRTEFQDQAGHNADQLASLTTSLNKSLLRENEFGPLTEDDQNLFNLGQKCIATAKELRKILGKIDEQRRTRAVDVGRKVFLHVRFKNKIEKITKQLQEQRALIDSNVLTCIRKHLDSTRTEQKDGFDHLDNLSQRIICLAEQERKIVDDQATLLQLIKEKLENNVEHVKTRDHVSMLHDQTNEHISNQFKSLETSLSRPKTLEQQWLLLGSVEICMIILESLDQELTSQRYKNVDKACQNTFHWIFEDESLQFNTWPSAKSLYWIRGKPASGKSTLMKFIIDDDRTHDLIEKSSNRRKVQAVFFFHNRGSEEQKTFQGLLQGILHQIFQQAPGILPSIAQDLSTSIRKDILEKKQIVWTLERLRSLWQLLIDKPSEELDVILFLDALDEYSGDHEEMIRFISDITQPLSEARTRVKICFSSRPWQVFLDAFEDLPGFHMEHYTQDDIKALIGVKMRQNLRMARLLLGPDSASKSAASKFSDKVAEKADGVILWVLLALKDLLNYFTAGESIQQLQHRLDDLPSKLEEYYSLIVMRISVEDRKQMLLMMEIVSQAQGSLTIEDFGDTFRFADTPNLAASVPTSCNRNDIDTAIDIERLINTKCGGLLQVFRSQRRMEHLLQLPQNADAVEDIIDTSSPISVLQVEFLHQTVKSFVKNSQTAKSLFQDYRCKDGNTLILKYLLALVAHRDFHTTDFGLKDSLVFGISQKILHHARKAEQTTGESSVAMFEELGDMKISEAYSSFMWRSEMQFPALPSILSFAVYANLPLLLKDVLAQKRDTPSNEPLLHLAIRYGDDEATILETLLEQGLDVNMKKEGKTAFQLLWATGAGKKRVEDFLRSKAKATETLLRYRCQPQDPIVYMSAMRRRMSRQRITTALHLAARHNDYESVKVLIEHGALVNALDGQAQTPLDGAAVHLRARVQAYLELVSSDYPNTLPNLPRRLQLIYLLLDNGAARNPEADLEEPIYARYPEYEDLPPTSQQLEQLRLRGLQVDSRLLSLPRLQKSVFARFWSNIPLLGSAPKSQKIG